MNVPQRPPPFSGRLTKVTGEGEQVELAFIAETPEQLTQRLAAAGAAATARLTTNNDAIVKAGATFEQRQRQVYDAAVSTLRQELSMERRDKHEPPADEPAEDSEPVGPPAPSDEPAEKDEPDADASAGTVHAPAYS